MTTLKRPSQRYEQINIWITYQANLLDRLAEIQGDWD